MVKNAKAPFVPIGCCFAGRVLYPLAVVLLVRLLLYPLAVVSLVAFLLYPLAAVLLVVRIRAEKHQTRKQRDEKAKK